MLSEVFPLFSNKISKRGFQHIWQGNTWKNIMPEAIQYVKSKEYLTKARSFAGQSAFSNDKQRIFNEIKEKKQKGLKRLEVYEEYKDIYSISGFNKVWYK